MPTLLSKPTFARLLERQRKISHLQPTGPMLPYAGEDLVSGGGGIYFVGIATDGDFQSDPSLSYAARIERVARMVQSRQGAASPFWRFIDQVCVRSFGRPFNECPERWGWSNLVKIGASEGVPTPELAHAQRDLCVEAFAEELGSLRRALVVVLTAQTHGILEAALTSLAGRPLTWDKRHTDAGIYTFDPRPHLRVLHAYHPKYAALARFFDAAAQVVCDEAPAYTGLPSDHPAP